MTARDLALYDAARWAMGGLQPAELRHPSRRDQVYDREIVAWALVEAGVSRAVVARLLGYSSAQTVRQAWARVGDWTGPAALRAVGLLREIRSVSRA